MILFRGVKKFNDARIESRSFKPLVLGNKLNKPSSLPEICHVPPFSFFLSFFLTPAYTEC